VRDQPGRPEIDQLALDVGVVAPSCIGDTPKTGEADATKRVQHEQISFGLIRTIRKVTHPAQSRTRLSPPQKCLLETSGGRSGWFVASRVGSWKSAMGLRAIRRRRLAHRKNGA
jgi:hypothetical protein